MDKPIEEKDLELSEYAKHQLEVSKRFAGHIRKLNETSTICYIDDDGYLVDRTPEGVVTRVPGVKRIGH